MGDLIPYPILHQFFENDTVLCFPDCNSKIVFTLDTYIKYSRRLLLFFSLVHQFIPICQFSFGRKRVLSVCVCVFTYSTKKFILFHHLHGACQFLPSTTVLASNNGFRIFLYFGFFRQIMVVFEF